MKIMIIRHADPDYSIDSLTPTGWIEAELLSERMKNVKVKNFYVSPLGRARDTANCTLKKIGREAEVCDWLQEFFIPVSSPDRPEKGCPWDWLPEDFTTDARMYSMENWTEVPNFKESDIKEAYENVTKNFDELLKKHGYERMGRMYKVNEANEDTIVFFCHFGLECVLLSHLLSIPPMMLWQGACAAPSSVTILNSEERRKGKASFRMSCFGDISHLYVAGREPSFHARFCETFDNQEQRHD